MIPCFSCNFGRNVKRKAMVVDRRVEGGREEIQRRLTAVQRADAIQKRKIVTCLRRTKEAFEQALSLELGHEAIRSSFHRCIRVNFMRFPCVSNASGSRSIGLGSVRSHSPTCPRVHRNKTRTFLHPTSSFLSSFLSSLFLEVRVLSKRRAFVLDRCIKIRRS